MQSTILLFQIAFLCNTSDFSFGDRARKKETNQARLGMWTSETYGRTLPTDLKTVERQAASFSLPLLHPAFQTRLIVYVQIVLLSHTLRGLMERRVGLRSSPSPPVNLSTRHVPRSALDLPPSALSPPSHALRPRRPRCHARRLRMGRRRDPLDAAEHR